MGEKRMYEITIKQTQPVPINDGYDSLDIDTDNRVTIVDQSNIKYIEVYKQCVDELDLSEVIIAINGIKE